jgi:hypothetical protein
MPFPDATDHIRRTIMAQRKQRAAKGTRKRGTARSKAKSVAKKAARRGVAKTKSKKRAAKKQAARPGPKRLRAKKAAAKKAGTRKQRKAPPGETILLEVVEEPVLGQPDEETVIVDVVEEPAPGVVVVTEFETTRTRGPGTDEK